MVDHNVFSVNVRVQPNSSYTQFISSFQAISTFQQQFLYNDSGPATGGPGITNGFQKLPASELEAIGAGKIVARGLANQSHVEFSFEAGFDPQYGTSFYTPGSNGSYISLTASSMVALSRGNVTVRSNSVSDYPNINPNVSVPALSLETLLSHLNVPSILMTPPTASSHCMLLKTCAGSSHTRP